MENEFHRKEFQVSRPKMPDGYGVPATNEGTLPWSYVDERMRAARNYWICSVRPDGRPHGTPVWGVWLDEKLYFSGSPETRRGRNIASNPAVTVHLESGDEVVILEGDAYEISAPGLELGSRLADAFSDKYRASGYEPGPGEWDQGGMYRFEPGTAFGWTKFPGDTTRWKLER